MIAQSGGDLTAMELLDALRLQLEWGADEALDESPLDRLSVSRAGPDTTHDTPPGATPGAGPVLLRAPPAATTHLALATPVARAQLTAAAAATVADLRGALAGFDACPLSATATQLVFADGNPAARLMVVGEGPGTEEDRDGRPFVGPSGQLLDRMLASIGLDRTQVLLTNLIPWRPPGNRNPTESEVATCLPFLLRHIALVRPARLVLLGALATRAILGGTAGIRRVRGKWDNAVIAGLTDPVPTLPMLHPAFLLRSPTAKAEAWADLRLLRRTLDADLPKK